MVHWPQAKASFVMRRGAWLLVMSAPAFVGQLPSLILQEWPGHGWHHLRLQGACDYLNNTRHPEPCDPPPTLRKYKTEDKGVLADPFCRFCAGVGTSRFLTRKTSPLRGPVSLLVRFKPQGR